MFMDEIMGVFCAINTSCKPDFSETTGKKNLLLKQNCSSCIDGVHLKGLMLQLCTTSAILPDLSRSRPLVCHSSEAIGSGLGATKLGVPQPEIREWDCYDCTGKRPLAALVLVNQLVWSERIIWHFGYDATEADDIAARYRSIASFVCARAGTHF